MINQLLTFSSAKPWIWRIQHLDMTYRRRWTCWTKTWNDKILLWHAYIPHRHLFDTANGIIWQVNRIVHIYLSTSMLIGGQDADENDSTGVVVVFLTDRVLLCCCQSINGCDVCDVTLQVPWRNVKGKVNWCGWEAHEGLRKLSPLQIIPIALVLFNVFCDDIV